MSKIFLSSFNRLFFWHYHGGEIIVCFEGNLGKY